MTDITAVKAKVAKLTTQCIEQKLQHIKPVATDNEGDLSFLDVTEADFFNDNFLWLGSFTEKADGLKKMELKYRSFHSYPLKGAFMPTLAEVFACLPDGLIRHKQIVAFELGDTLSDECDQPFVYDEDLHASTISLYCKA